MDFVGKQEKLPHDLITVLDKIGVDYDPDRIVKKSEEKVNENRSRQISCSKLNKSVIEKLYKTEYSAFQQYGYEIEEF